MRYAIIGILVLFLLAACSTGQTTTQATTPTDTASSAAGNAASSANGAVKEFTMIAKQWEFDPGTITVNKGDTVLLHITSTDVEHGFGLPDFGVDALLPPGKTVDVRFVADKTGTFTFYCSVYCGAGHRSMRGQLIVK